MSHPDQLDVLLTAWPPGARVVVSDSKGGTFDRYRGQVLWVHEPTRMEPWTSIVVDVGSCHVQFEEHELRKLDSWER